MLTLARKYFEQKLLIYTYGLLDWWMIFVLIDYYIHYEIYIKVKLKMMRFKIIYRSSNIFSPHPTGVLL